VPTITLIPQAAFGTLVSRFKLGPYTARIEKDLRVQRGPVHYEYVLSATDRRIEKITFFITSERNTLHETLGTGSHFLCLFINNRRVNLGPSDDWGDIEKFEATARRIIEQVIAREEALKTPQTEPKPSL
jgi:hypothetical protein